MLYANEGRAVLKEGLQKGGRGTLWMLKILVPISFFTFLIDSSGILGRLDHWLEPAMGLFHLPPSAALPLIAGLLAGIYGAIAAMGVLDFSLTESILMAVFLLISHALPQESLVQARSGMRFFKATLVRLAASVLVTFLLARVLSIDSSAVMPVAENVSASVSFASLLGVWVWDTAQLCLKILVIITAMMVLLAWLRAVDLIPVLARMLNPLLRVLGLNRSVGILWLTAAVFGLSYGAAVIVEETREGHYAQADIRRLPLSIGINHAMIEDPLLFLAMGIPAFWLWGPRLAAAIAVVYLDHLWCRFRARRPQREAPLPHGDQRAL
ncbi:MAG: nucleoside recognition domain-containing protein [Desulfosarcina sp.]|nr:nucleoside recognition domain-containing protein [Desulfobacterales bacterium]